MFQRTLYCDDNEVLFCYSRCVTDIIYVHPLLRVDSFISVKYNLLPSSFRVGSFIPYVMFNFSFVVKLFHYVFLNLQDH